MKRLILGLAIWVSLFGVTGRATADLVGLTVDAAFAAPSATNIQTDFGKLVINPTAHFTLSFGESVTITGTQLIYTGPGASGQYVADPFNGYVFDFLNSGSRVTSVTVDPSSTLPGFLQSSATLLSDGAGGQLVELNFGQGLSFGAGQTVVLDLAPVPEPSSLLLSGVGALGVLGYRRWRPRTA